MRRILPYPILSLGLFVASILLSASVAPPSLVLALLLALLAPIVMLALGVDRVRLKSPRAMILGRRRHERTSGFIHIPLDLRDRYGLAVLAIIITSTPGTLWVEYEAATGRLLLHVLDLVDEETWVRLIKDRYERRLMEIFE